MTFKEPFNVCDLEDFQFNSNARKIVFVAYCATCSIADSNNKNVRCVVPTELRVFSDFLVDYVSKARHLSPINCRSYHILWLACLLFPTNV